MISTSGDFSVTRPRWRLTPLAAAVLVALAATPDAQAAVKKRPVKATTSSAQPAQTVRVLPQAPRVQGWATTSAEMLAGEGPDEVLWTPPAAPASAQPAPAEPTPEPATLQPSLPPAAAASPDRVQAASVPAASTSASPAPATPATASTGIATDANWVSSSVPLTPASTETPAAETSSSATPIAAASAASPEVVEAPAATPRAAGALADIDTVGERLGWMSSAEIASLPEARRPKVDATCEGAWVTPIASSVQVKPFEAEDVKALANSLFYRDNGEAVLSGQVRIEQPGRLVEADNGTLTEDREFARFDGNIRLAEPGLLVTADQAVVNVNSRAGQLQSTEFISSDINAHGRAEQIRRLPDGVTYIERGIYTTCAPGARSWSFDASDITLNPNTGIGEVTHAKLRLGDVPVVYLPYYRFPIDDRRMTGFLIPRFGNTNDGGFDLSVPIYLNIAPQVDATVTPRLINRRGAMMEGELRYLTQSLGSGEIEGEYLPDDQLDGRDRKRGSYNHRASWGEGWSARTSLNYVSDFAYFTDLGNDLTVSNRTHQERVGEINYTQGRWNVLGRVQGFQTIDPDLLDGDRPYARLPQILVTTEKDRLPGWQTNLRAEVANFQRDVSDGSVPEINGLRMRLDPSLRYDYSRPWGYVRPGAKLSHLQYSLEGDGASGNNNPSLTIPTLSLDSGLIFERFSASGSSQTIEPRLYYLFAPFKDQVDNPNFDSSNITFAYDQLFRDSRFSGSDRIDDANQVSAGVTTRWSNAEGFENLSASVGQIIYFRDREVRLPVTGLVVPPVADQPTSSYAGNLTWRANEELSVFADALLNPEGGRLSQYSAAVNLRPLSGGSLYNAGYRYRVEDLTIGQQAVSQTHLSFIKPLGLRWKLLGLWNYDTQREETQESLLGVSYESCCWQVRVFQRRYLADAAAISETSDRERKAIFVEVSLKGLAGVGSGVDALLEKNVFGYTQLQQKEENF